MTTFILRLLAASLLGNLPLFAAVAGHIRAHRIRRELDDIDRIEAGFHGWTEHTPVTPLRAVDLQPGGDWPQRQTPTDLQTPYEPTPLRNIPPPDWDAVLREARAYNWAVAQFNRIVAVSNEYDELVAA